MFADSSGEETRGLHHLSGDDPFSPPIEKAGAREDHRLPPLGCRVEVLLFLHGDMTQITAQDGAVQRGIEIGSFLCGALLSRFGTLLREESLFGEDREDLIVDIAPLPHSAIGQKVFPAEATQSVLRLR